MVKVFQKIDGSKVEIVKHTLDVLEDFPNTVIHVGTDSQNTALHTKYAVVVAYRFGTRGVHYIYKNFMVDRINDKFTRLLKEAEYSIEIAQWISEKIKIEIQIDLDYNANDKYFSNKLIPMTKGWANSLGYKVNVKPNEQIATRAADYQCR
jgi:predicted RNase H-related nuclease YkuK (DUF458 family)